MAEKVQIGLPIDSELNDKISKLAPRGMKAQAIRALLELMFETQKDWFENGRTEFVVDHLLRGRMKLILRDEAENDQAT